MVSPGVYNMRTLNDNWLEDRAQPQGMLTALSGLTHRSPRAVETDLAYVGDRYDVLSRISRIPARPTYAMPDDGFNVKESTHQGDFVPPASHPMFSTKKCSAPPMINTANAPVCPPETRPLPGPESGFGAPLPRHPRAVGQRLWNTTHGDFYGVGDRRPSPRTCPSTLPASGVNSADAEVRVAGLRCGQLCGEAFRETRDPGLDTRTQRAWMPGGDPGIASVHLGGSRPPPPTEDNELSLPLGDAMGKVRADLAARKGRLARVATMITKEPNQKAGYAIFADD